MLLLTLLTACNLRYAEQRHFCATADEATCASRPDWCIVSGGSRCVPAAPGADCTACVPEGTTNAAPCTSRPPPADECLGVAHCVTDDTLCKATCIAQVEPMQCIARNLCNDVICF